MLFNSISFALFLPVVFVLYWSVQKANLRIQNSLVLVFSYVFYGMWDWRFAVLLLISTYIDYFIGIGLRESKKGFEHKLLFWLSVFVNVGTLGFFKYYNFFVTSFSDLLGLVGLSSSLRTLSLLMPVGISFYTFKKLSYTIDVYRGKIEPTRDILAFFAFVSFFPQIMAGPIDRGSTLLPQFLKKRVFSDPLARDGARQILSGFLKKMVIADNLLPIVNDLFTNYSSYDGLSLSFGIFFAAMQLYCDFSGYSDIAIGVGKLFGFELMKNFAFPYFARDIAEFWRRWHISLSTWIRDYIYVPLCGVRPSRAKKGLFIVVTFTLCGLWHGAAWTYVFWGFLHGLYFLPMTLKKRHPRFIGIAAKGRIFASFKESKAMLITFISTSIAWVFFMADSFSQAFGLLGRVVTNPYSALNYTSFLPMFFACLLLMVLEWFQREKEFFLDVSSFSKFKRHTIYVLLVFTLLVFSELKTTSEFIYVNF